MNVYVARTRPALTRVDIGIALRWCADVSGVHQILGTPGAARLRPIDTALAQAASRGPGEAGVVEPVLLLVDVDRHAERMVGQLGAVALDVYVSLCDADAWRIVR
jgi:hypothetical protein